METIDIHSKSFVVKWIQVPDNSNVIFQLKPIKRSINFSIYRSLSSGVYSTSNSPALKPVDISSAGTDSSIPQLPPQQHQSQAQQLAQQEISNNSSSTSLNRKRSNSTISLEDKLRQSALVKVHSYGTLNGNQLFKHEFKVEKGGVFAFIFDNTFSKSYSKKVLFNKFFLEAPSTSNPERPSISSSSSSINISNPGQLHPKKGQYLQGYLLKKKRKKLQGFTKRFFILNFKYNTLSYYMNENSLKIRGEMPVNLSTISAFKDDNIFIIDSGMEIWTLKTLNKEDWDNWTNALNFIKFNSTNSSGPNAGISSTSFPQSQQQQQQQQQQHQHQLHPPTEFTEVSKIEESNEELKDEHLVSINTQIENLSQQFSSLESNLDQTSLSETKNQLKDLSSYVKHLISSTKTRKNKTSKDDNTGYLSPTATSIFSQEFFDAQEQYDTIDQGDDFDLDDDGSIDNHVLLLPTTKHRNRSNIQVDLSSSSSSNASIETGLQNRRTSEFIGLDSNDLSPLPLDPVKRRNDVPKSNSTPPSLLSFLRKNVGKDLSTIAMPVTSNEPITILQKIAETFEYSQLLNEAALETNNDVKILKIASFAISNLGAMRIKERNLRKPFNPILGETFELVREDLGYRFLAEKIHHKPQIFAINCESQDWEVSFCLNPEQKFWGKSLEIINKGVVTLIFKNTGEIYKWQQPSTLLKNIIAGERYSEPANSISISSSIGLKSVVEFKKPSGGIFSAGKSEEVLIKVYSEKGHHHDLFVDGKWTSELSLHNAKDPNFNVKIWQVSSLLNNYEQKYGFNEFTANLNDITTIEKGWIPFTDSRFRPDIQAYESGDLKNAEILKLEVEQKQRDRRKVLADSNQIHKPNFFKQTNKDDEMSYEIIRGEESYWNKRKLQDWDELTQLW